MTVIQASKERWFEAEANRIAGQIALKSPEPDAAKAEAYFGRALALARQQQAKSWELRAAMSLARLWRDQGKVRSCPNEWCNNGEAVVISGRAGSIKLPLRAA